MVTLFCVTAVCVFEIGLVLMALVWQAVMVVAIAKAQARRKDRAGSDKGAGMMYSTYIKRAACRLMA